MQPVIRGLCLEQMQSFLLRSRVELCFTCIEKKVCELRYTTCRCAVKRARSKAVLYDQSLCITLIAFIFTELFLCTFKDIKVIPE